MPWNRGPRPRSFAGRLAVVLAGICQALCVSTWPAIAQKPRVETFTVGEGLPSSTIYDLEQDASGRLWILSRAGLAVYDGRAFYRPASVDALPSHRLAALEVDEDGRLWTVSRAGKQVYYLEGQFWRRLPPPRVPDGGEVRWATSLLAPERGQSLVVVGTADEGLLIWDGAAWAHVPAGDGPVSDRITGLEAHGGKIFVGTDAGLCTLETSRVDCRLGETEPRLRDRIFALREAPAVLDAIGRRLWILGSSWLGWLQDGRLTVVAEGLEVISWNRGPKGDLAFDAFGGIYFGSPAAVYFFDPVERRVRELGLRDGLAADGLTTILSDRESTVWLGSLRGLSKVSSRRFLSYDRDLGLLESEVSAIAERRPGELILGHHNGLTFLDGDSIEPLAFDHVARDLTPRVLDMAVDGRGTVWIAAQDAGLLRLDGRDLTPVLDHAFSVEIDRAGRLWTVGYGGLRVAPEARKQQIVDGDGFERVALSVGVELTGMLRWLAVGPGGEVYIAARLGLLWNDGGDWHHARGPDDEAADVFNVLVTPTPQGPEVWAGTAGGLYRLEGGELVKSNTPSIDRPVYQILEDLDGRTWFGTDDGLLIWDGARPSQGEASRASLSQAGATSLRHLSVRHGLAGRETNRGAALVDYRGRVWIGTAQGVSMYQGHYDLLRQVPPILELRALEAGGRLRAAAAPADLSHRENTLVFHVDAICLTDEEEAEARYRLDGFDRGWQGPAPLSGSEIRYTNVPPGRYRFRIAGRRGRSEWSPEAESGSIAIARPAWREGWFYALVALSLALVVAGAHGIRVQAMRTRNRELEALSAKLSDSVIELEQAQAEREALIEDLESKNQELERFTYTVSHDLKSPLVTIRGFVGLLKQDVDAGDVVRAHRDVERISAAAGTMGQLLDELLELSRLGRMVNPPETVGFDRLVEEAVEILSHRLAERGVEMEVAPDLPAVSGDRVRLLEVVQNLIENAVKFMGDQAVPRIEIGVRHDLAPEGGDSEPVLYVKDNGIGIEPRYHDKIFGLFDRLDQTIEGTGVGLAIVHRIVELHGGRIWIESEGAGKGATFCFTLPLEAVETRLGPAL